MFEAKLAEGHVLKKIIESIKDIVTDVNIDISPSGKLAPILKIPEYLSLPCRNFTLSNGQLTCCFGFPQFGSRRL